MADEDRILDASLALRLVVLEGAPTTQRDRKMGATKLVIVMTAIAISKRHSTRLRPGSARADRGRRDTFLRHAGPGRPRSASPNTKDMFVSGRRARRDHRGRPGQRSGSPWARSSGTSSLATRVVRFEGSTPSPPTPRDPQQDDERRSRCARRWCR